MRYIREYNTLSESIRFNYSRSVTSRYDEGRYCVMFNGEIVTRFVYLYDAENFIRNS